MGEQRPKDLTGWAAIAVWWASNGQGPPELEPERMADPLAATVARMALSGLTREQIAALIPDIGMRLAAIDLDGRPKHPGSTWAELGRVLGPLSWAWPYRIPDAMLTMVVAEQGRGKSCLCLRIAETYLVGTPWPDGQPFAGQLGCVLWCEAEASQGVNFARAQDWGLPVERVLSPLEDPLSEVLLQDPDHMAAIEEWAHRPEVRLVVVDSLSGANTARENDAAMLHITKRLASLAVATGKPIILTHHLRKRGVLDLGDRVTLDRIRGSGAITQAARSVLAIDAPDPQAEDALRLSNVKNNLVGVTQAGAPIGMRIGAEGVSFSADAPEMPREETAQDKAADLLMALLRKGPMRATELQNELEAAGASWDAAKRAKTRLGIVSRRELDEHGKAAWWWALPVRHAGGE